MRNGRDRRLIALHNAELAGRKVARVGGSIKDNPYLGKKLRGAIIGLFRAWERGFNEQKETEREGD